MDALQKARQRRQRVLAVSEETMHAQNERNEFNELSQPDSSDTRHLSSNSFLSSAENITPAISAAVTQLHDWLEGGYLHTLPDPVPGFPGTLSQYRDQEQLIAFTRHILARAPWSLTGEERAAQFVAVLAPLMEGRAA